MSYNDEPQCGGLIDKGYIIKSVTLLVGVIGVITFLGWPMGSVGQVYLGYYPEENITKGTEQRIKWHDEKLTNTECYNKEVLNTIDVCGGHVTVFCKKRWSFAYNWCEVHCMSNECYWDWW